MSRFMLALFTFSLSVFTVHAHEGMSKEQMKKFRDYATPSDWHKTLSRMAGQWTFTSKMWQGPQSKVEETTGTADMKMILGGRYLQQNVNGTVMGQAYEGIGTMGYDNLKKEYTSLWMDTMSTGITRGTASYDKKTKTFNEKGEYTCPMESDNEGEYRGEWKLIDDNNMVYSMYTNDPKTGAEYKMMEMTYKRSK